MINIVRRINNFSRQGDRYAPTVPILQYQAGFLDKSRIEQKNKPIASESARRKRTKAKKVLSGTVEQEHGETGLLKTKKKGGKIANKNIWDKEKQP